jgi:hypothetical protein
MRTREPLATPQEVAAYTRYAVGTLRKWRSTGEGPPFIGRGRGVRYRWADVEKWLAAQSNT